MEQADIQRAMDALAKSDPDMAVARALVGDPEPRVRPHGFESLLRIIVSQQISTHAARAILLRLEAALPAMQPDQLLAADPQALRQAGLSARKVEYAQGLARAIVEGSLDIEGLPQLDDEAVIGQIAALRGFGRWSAEIYCMFALGRADIFPADDLALQEAVRRLKKMPDRPKPAAAREIASLWQPWRSIASLFLWHYYAGAPQ